MLENSDKIEPFLTIDIEFLIESIFGLKTSPQRKKTLSKDSFEHFGHPKLL